jgi:COP9 signalosome complex subunit 5
MSSQTIPTPSRLIGSDKLLIPDSSKLDQIKKSAAWTLPGNEKYFKKVLISSVAAMKMMAHASTGVETGMTGPNRMPTEIMGLVEGHINTDDPSSLVVTDVFPLPVEGTETNVVADSDDVILTMVSLSDALEKTRDTGDPHHRTFMGWYHSHPFDVGEHSNCFLSSTDVSSQLIWQIPEDKTGNPWFALVVDPLRGLAQGRPEIGAFRCYPTTYVPPKGLAPDGVIWSDEKARNKRWGESCISYYNLEVEYWMSNASSSFMDVIARDFKWVRVLSSSSTLDESQREKIQDQLHQVGALVDKFDFTSKRGDLSLTSSNSRGGFTYGSGLSMMKDVFQDKHGSYSGGGGGGGGGDGGSTQKSSISEAATNISEIASDLLRGQGIQFVKAKVFDESGEEKKDKETKSKIFSEIATSLET